MKNIKHLMTYRSATENKVNDIMCADNYITFTPNVNVLSYFLYLCRVKVMAFFGGSITKHSLVFYAINFLSKPSGRGTVFNHKIRQVYYTLRSIGISV
jgi:hypothetical protein